MRANRAEHMEEIMNVLVAAGKPVGMAYINPRVVASGSSLAYTLKLMEDRGLVEFLRHKSGSGGRSRSLYKATAKGHAVDFKTEKGEQEANGALQLKTEEQKNPINALAPLFMKLTFDREREAEEQGWFDIRELERFAPVC